MKARRGVCWLPALILLALPSLGYAQDGTISGVVHDADGRALAAARVTITGEAIASYSLKATTSEEGKYKFAGLREGDYAITAELAGLARATPAKVHLSPDAKDVSIDLTLSKLPAPGPSTARPPLTLQASGVRGLIDPGGYSAATQAAAASGLVQGVAGIKRQGNESGLPSSQEIPCDAGPSLRRAAEAVPVNAEAYHALGSFYLAHDQAAKAVPLLERARQAGLTDYSASRDLALALIKSGQFRPAHELLTALPERQNEPEVHRLLARALEGQEMFQQASQEYQLAATRDPTDENLFGVGYELILAGLPVDAAKAFESGLRQVPKSITLLVGEGTAQFLQHDGAASVHTFLQATDINPTDPRPYLFLSNSFGLSEEDQQRVRERLKRFLDLAPNNAAASYYYALSLWRDRGLHAVDVAQVESLLKHAISLDPGMAKAHFQLAALYAEQNDNIRAEEEYGAALRLDPSLKEAHYRLALVEKRLGKEEPSEREMKLFRGAGSRETPADAVDISQLVSVIEPAQSAGAPSAQCPPDR